MIPPEARVDPGRFPEADFPLYCPSCGYLLRGLTSDRCPECGRPFERGRLLVEQYVIERGKRLSRRTTAWAKRTLVIGIVLFAASWLSLALTVIVWSPMRPAPPVMDLASIWLGVPAMMLALVSGGLQSRAWSVARDKSRQVFEAIDRASPAFQRAQRVKGFRQVANLILLVGVLVCQVTGVGGTIWSGYWLRHPTRLLLLLAPAVVAIPGYFLVRLWRRKRRS
jgi:hypothetical protein